ncbi:MAG TPA: glutathione S-transferase family protein [Steroidobacteraceae bacterium]|jgi:glutathione S-transferase|nr:glutathione S-transferase family protein [Steroidobacteraceae bacterium]
MLRVLGRNTSGNVQKVIWLLEELGTPYQRENYGRQFNNTNDAAYLRLNPNGKVPTLVDGDVVVWESNTILRYLCNRYGGEALYPTDAMARSLVERWMDWQLAALYGPYLALFKEARKPPAERAASFAADAGELQAQLGILERGASLRPWVLAGELSLADICLGPIVHRCLDFPVDLPGLTAVKAWRERIAARPAFKKATA